MKKILIALTFLAFFAAIVFAQSTTIILTTDNLADKPLAQVLSEKLNAKLVETEWGIFSDSALNEIKNLAPQEVIIIGGKIAIPETAETQLSALGIKIKRLAGENRYETAALIAELGWPNGTSNAVFVEGYDAEGIKEAIAQAKAEGVPIIIIAKNKIPEKVREKILKLKIKRALHIRSAETSETEIDDDFENSGITVNKTEISKQERTLNAITKAEEAISTAENEISNADNETLKLAAQRVLNNAKRHLENAKTAYDEEKYGHAFGQAVSARELAENSLRIAKHRLVKKELKEVVEETGKEIREKGLIKAKAKVRAEAEKEIREKVKKVVIEKKVERKIIAKKTAKISEETSKEASEEETATSAESSETTASNTGTATENTTNTVAD